MNTKDVTIKRYDEIVLLNISNDFSAYKDPDQVFEEEIFINDELISSNGKSVNIRLSSDGLCSIKKIQEYSKDILSDYKCVREGMFECLIWPAYALSINQMRGYKSTCDDRIDLTLIDIQKFYEKIAGETELSIGLIKKLTDAKNGCVLARAYLNLMTFSWLCSFKDFDDFVKQRKLQPFVEERSGIYIAKQWTSSKKFDKEYYNELMKHIKDYRIATLSNVE